MSVGPGSVLQHYRLVEKIGEGGMGEVWKAVDNSLGREAAIKILPTAFATDPDRLARFEREAKLLASLNHPNIAGIYGLHQHESIRFLAMEMVGGEDLAQRSKRGPVPLHEALDIARQVADALEAAHEQGIVHRDLKPANVVLTPDGKVKVLDFGLAKALDPAASDPGRFDSALSPTVTSLGSVAGMILGTAAYMSPEQARGKPVDKRADLWAFGCVLYELLSGRQAFGGETVTDILAAVVTRDPDWSALPASTPLPVRRLLRRCIERDPRRRLRDAGDAKLLLEENPLDATMGAAAMPAAPLVPAWRRALPWTLIAVLAAALATALVMRGARTSITPSPAALAVRLPADVTLDIEGNTTEHDILVVSPDGSRIVFVGFSGDTRRLYVRPLDELWVTPLAGTEDASSPFFSPDGRWVAFFARSKLKKVSVGGGQPVDICDVGLDRGGAWGPDGTIVFSSGTTSPLMRVPSGGGSPTALTQLDADRKERTHRWPAFLPGGKEVAFTVGTSDKPGTYEDARIEAASLATGKRRVLFAGASRVRCPGTGPLLLGRGTQVFALPLEAATGSAVTNAVPVLQGVAGVASSGVLFFDVADNGTLVYAENDPKAAELELVRASRDGRMDPLPVPPHEYRSPRISPDGKRLAVGVGPGHGAATDIWIHGLVKGDTTRLTFDNRSGSPAWTPDGSRVAFGSFTRGDTIESKAADGSDKGTLLAAFNESVARTPLTWSPDGKFVVYQQEGGPGRSVDLMLLSVHDGRSSPLVATPAIDIGADISPDGRWLAYCNDESGQFEIYVQPFPGPGGRWQISDGGNGPKWSRDGKELYYVSQGRMMAVSVQTGPSLSFGKPHPLFETRFPTSTDTYTNYDVGPDGTFVMVRTTSRVSTSRHLDVVLNWLDALRRAAK